MVVRGICLAMILTRAASFQVRATPSRWVTKLAATVTDIKGEVATESFRVFFKSGDNSISPWHDIPLYNEDGTVNMVTEIPKMTKAKMEVATKEENNPIAQDIKKR